MKSSKNKKEKYKRTRGRKGIFRTSLRFLDMDFQRMILISFIVLVILNIIIGSE